MNTVVVDESGDKLLRNVSNYQKKVRYIPAYRSAPYKMSATRKELFIIICRMEGSATVRFEVGFSKPRGFRETLDKASALCVS